MNRSPLWTSLGLVAPLYARLNGMTAPPVSGVSIDTRTLAPGDLFFAIKGDHSNGHDYVAAAFENGAAAAVVDEAHADALFQAGPLYIVHDTFAAMQSLGLTARARTNAAIAAVTGSVGKTSTKDALALVLSAQGATHSSTASYNNHWGVPLTLCRMPKDSRFGVFEIGMNHAGEITPLVGMVKPQVALITTVEAVHLEFFPSVAAIADAKAEIFSGLCPGGTAVVNRDNPHYERLVEAAKVSPAGRILSFGADPSADIRLLEVDLRPDRSDVVARAFGRDIRYRIGSPGRHIVQNSLGVIAVIEALGADLDAALEAYASVVPPGGRGARIGLAKGLVLIDESYNANPASMRAAFALLAQATPKPGGRRIAVIGDMRELGPDAARLHAGLAEDLSTSGIDLVFACGPLMASLWDAIPNASRGAWAADSAALEPQLLEALRPGDVVMVKGSLGSRMGRIVQALTSTFGPATDAGQQG